MIIKTEFWNDVGFLESSYEVPSLTDVLPEPDFEYNQQLHPATDRLFSEIQLPEAWSELLNISYVRVTYGFNNSETQTFCGWVDSVSLKSDTDGYPITVINWHIDFWRTYASKAVFGAGLVKRAKPSVVDDSDLVPPQSEFQAVDWGLDNIYNYPYSFRRREMWDNSGIWWVYFTYTDESTQGTINSASIYCFPVHEENAWVRILCDGNFENSMRLGNVITGVWDEMLKLTPSRIKAAFLSPYPPDAERLIVVQGEDTGGGETAYNVNLSNGGWEADKYHGSTYAIYKMRGTSENPFPEWDSKSLVAHANDTHRILFTDCDNNTFGELPWGFYTNKLWIRTVMSTTSGYIQFRYYDDPDTATARGLAFTMPLIPLEVTENSWSEYNYTGAREYDRRSRELQSQQKAISEITGAAMSGAQMGLAGGMESAVGELSTPKMFSDYKGSAGVRFGKALGMTAGVGTGVGLAMGAVSAGTGYLLETQIFNPAADKLENFGRAKQSDGLVMAGSGFDAVYRKCVPAVMDLEMDQYTQQRRTNYLTQYGYLLDIQLADCTPVIQAGGGVRIVNLNVTGDIPKQAKEYIRNRLANGVHIK